jgi:hypothetical protein
VPTGAEIFGGLNTKPISNATSILKQNCQYMCHCKLRKRHRRSFDQECLKEQLALQLGLALLRLWLNLRLWMQVQGEAPPHIVRQQERGTGRGPMVL